MRFIITLSLLAGCLTTEPIPDASLPSDAWVPPQSPQVRAWKITDHLGREWESDRAPRRPRIVLEMNTRMHTSDDPIEDGLFVIDASDTSLESLRDDLERKPVRVAHTRALVQFTVAPDGRTLELETTTLELGRNYLIALAPWAQSVDGEAFDSVFVQRFTVRRSNAGAVVVDAWPAPGAAGVDSEIPFAAIRFDDEVEGIEAISFEGPDGAVHTEHERVACAELGWDEGECVMLRWEGELRPDQRYTWTVTDWVRDRGGAPVGPWAGDFETSTATPLSLMPQPCALDEVETDIGCVFTNDSSADIRLVASAPFRAFVALGDRYARGVAPRGELTLSLDGLVADQEHVGTLRLEGYTQTRTFEVVARTTTPLPAITISEVRADPRGPEPHQEYVELVNFGAVPVSLQDYRIADRADREGDVLGATVLPPQGRALIVAPTFVPDHADDPAVPPGTLLVRLDGSIASGGLSNAGEPVYLRDPEGRRVSMVPAMESPGAGLCWARVDHSRRGEPNRFVARECRPGLP